jgi:hypothetical protein
MTLFSLSNNISYVAKSKWELGYLIDNCFTSFTFIVNMKTIFKSLFTGRYVVAS